MTSKTKKEAEAVKSALLRDWVEQAGLSNVPEGDLDFSSFYAWLKERHPEYTRFRSVGGAEDAWERWFAREFGQMWKY